MVFHQNRNPNKDKSQKLTQRVPTKYRRVMKVEKRIGEAEVAGQLGGAHNNHIAYSTCMKLSKNKLSNFF